MRAAKYKANFVAEIGYEKASAPDVFIPEDGMRRPPPDFVISRYPEGETISVYSDEVWDLRVYRLAGNAGAARVNFEFAEGEVKGEVKWIVFMLLFIAEPQVGGAISVATVMSYMKAIRAIVKFSSVRQCSILDVLSDRKVMGRFISGLENRNLISGFSGVLTHLITIPSDVSGYQVLGFTKHELVTNRLRDMREGDQHPVVPPRILSLLISQLDEFILLVHAKLSSIESFLENILSDSRFARSKSMQSKLGVRAGNFAPFFDEASELYGLRELFERYRVRDLPSLSTLLTRTQHACRIYIHIYSGMRSSEALSLNLGCLSKVVRGRRAVLRIHGETSKLVGQKKPVSWVTSEEVVPSVEVASAIALIVGKHIGLQEDETPLFISMGYLEFSCPLQHKDGIVRLAVAGGKSQEIYPYLDGKGFRIISEDLDVLERISPFRAWEAEAAFSVGAVWRFTTHQFRRSLAFYVAQSANVSLPSLKRQFKHLTRDMTIYYCQGSGQSSEFNSDSHIAFLLQREKYESDAVAYIYDAILSGDKLGGAHGRHVERNLRGVASDAVILLESRSELVSKFKKGLLAYAQTPLGACMTSAPCDKRLFRSIAGCLNCDSAIIKLKNLDRVIEHQERFVSDLTDSGESTVELRTEKEELAALIKFRDVMRSKGG